MIGMSCPACGAVGRIPKDKINTRLVCKKCLKVFHVVPSGVSVLGPPPETGVTAHRSEPAAAAEPSMSLEDLLERLPKLRSVLVTVGVLVGALFLAYGWSFVSAGGSETPQDRGEKVVQAALSDNLAEIERLSLPGTGEEVSQWYNTIRPQCIQFKSLLGSAAPSVMVLLLQDNVPTTGSVNVTARLSSQQAVTTRGAITSSPIAVVNNPVVEIPLVITSEGWSRWRFDARRTLDASAKPGK